MCFIGEGDWTASVCEKTYPVATKNIRCDECNRTIEIGETYHHIYMQEYEECQDCENDGCECPLDEDGGRICHKNGCQCEKPSYGEDATYDCCQECQKFRQAIHDAEIEAGCREYESQPMLGSMFEEIQEQDPIEARKYFKTALRLFPELKQSGYLGRHWKSSFSR